MAARHAFLVVFVAMGRVTALLTLATWNVLSVSKSDTLLNGFPNFNPDAFAIHNGVSCKGSLGVKASKKVKSEAGENLTETVDCSSTWIRGAVEQLKTDTDFDVLVLQEIDYHMLLGLEAQGNMENLKFAPLSGDPYEDVKKARKGEVEKEKVPKSKPAKDEPYVVWDTKRVADLKCKGGKIATCTFTKDKTTYNIIGMHAPGDGFQGEGLTKALPELKKQGLVYDAVLGDWNVPAWDIAEASVKQISEALEVAGEKEENMETVFRYVHKGRKLVQEWQNSWQSKEKKTLICTDTADWDTKFCGEWNAMYDQIVEYDKQKQKATSLKLKFGESSKWQGDINKLYTDYGHDDFMKKFKINEGKVYDWKTLPFTLGSNPSLAATDEAQAAIEKEKKREDYAAYNKMKFELTSIHVHNYKAVNDVYNTEGTPKLPTTANPSDHLPVIMTIKPLKGWSRIKFNHREKTIKNMKVKDNIEKVRKFVRDSKDGVCFRIKMWLRKQFGQEETKKKALPDSEKGQHSVKTKQDNTKTRTISRHAVMKVVRKLLHSGFGKS